LTSLSSVLPARAAPAARVIVRHSPLVRVCHWVNAICVVVLLMSGMQIFNASPLLTWGQTTNFTRPFFSLSAHRDDNGDPTAGLTTIFGHAFDTTGGGGGGGGGGRRRPPPPAGRQCRSGEGQLRGCSPGCRCHREDTGASRRDVCRGGAACHHPDRVRWARDGQRARLDKPASGAPSYHRMINERIVPE
jgi:hypothetical protein